MRTMTTVKLVFLLCAALSQVQSSSSITPINILDGAFNLVIDKLRPYVLNKNAFGDEALDFLERLKVGLRKFNVQQIIVVLVGNNATLVDEVWEVTNKAGHEAFAKTELGKIKPGKMCFFRAFLQRVRDTFNVREYVRLMIGSRAGLYDKFHAAINDAYKLVNIPVADLNEFRALINLHSQALDDAQEEIEWP